MTINRRPVLKTSTETPPFCDHQQTPEGRDVTHSTLALPVGHPTLEELDDNLGMQTTTGFLQQLLCDNLEKKLLLGSLKESVI